MDLSLFDYQLPPDRIAQYPAERRDASRLLALDRMSGGLEDRLFSELPDLLRPGDLLVLNDSRVIPARLLGQLADSDREIELLLIRELAPARWEALARPARALKPGGVVVVGDGAVAVRVAERLGEGRRLVEFPAGMEVLTLLRRHGVPPLPPYIARHCKPGAEDWERYQTVYAKHDGSVAAPTAGLHFTEEVLSRLQGRGVGIEVLTLHVGPGTFQPIRAARVEAHRMEAERMEVPGTVAVAIDRAKSEGHRVIAVGTTTTRALESAARDGRVHPLVGEADLFIYPGYRFRVIDGLLTNFHLPRSSLLCLVSAFAGREQVLAAYRHAVEKGYRFYSYGDAMLIA